MKTLKIKMKHYVLGLVLDKYKTEILLIKKEKPLWMKEHWNGIGGKIEENETSLQAMHRECSEETGFDYDFEHTITFICPGGTVFVFMTTTTHIDYIQKEEELLKIWDMNKLPKLLMDNLNWIIPLSMSTVQKPIILQQNNLGVTNAGTL